MVGQSDRNINQKNLDLVSRIYDLPLRPERWQAVLDEFAPVMNASVAGIAVYNPIHVGHEFAAMTSNFGVSNEEYRDKLPDQYQSGFVHMTEYPKRGFIPDLEMLRLDSIEEYAKRPIIQWLKRDFNIFHGAASCLNLERAWSDVLFVMYSGDRGSITPQEKKDGDFFLDHFAKSAELGRAFGVLKNRFDGVLTALDRFHIGIFILSPGGAVVLKNTEASRLVDADDGFTLSRDGYLTPTDEGPQGAFRDAVQKAVSTAQAQHTCAETLLTVSRRSGKDAYLVEVAPICDDEEIEGQFKGCLVFVIDPVKTDVVSTKGMQVLYSLTNSEAEVCKLVAEGLATDDIADARSLTRETVRNYIKQVLHKTGTGNRSQLVRLALRVNLPIDPPPREE